MKHKPQTSELVVLSTRIENKSSRTLLDFLTHRFTYLTEDEWKERIKDGKVLVNELRASEGQPLRAGDEVAYTTPAWEEPPVNPNYRVIFEDETLMVLSKPSPLPVHAIGAYFRNTLMYLLRQDRPDAKDYHLVHRLDSETSGLLMLVKDKKHLTSLQRQWKTGEVKKNYRAIIFGKFEPIQRRVEAAIGPLKGSRIRMKLGIDEAAGKPSVTEFESLETRGNYSLVEARPLTGRTHQIRVHLETLGYPIVGDKLYSGDEETFLHFIEHGWDDRLREKVKLPRLALHAFRLEFIHPVTGQKMILEDQMPEDLNRFWNQLT